MAQYPYSILARSEDFQAMVDDMLYRSGIQEEKIRNVIRLPNSQNKRMEVYQEFAKCFVPQSIDQKNNYELYEFMGDSAVNKATISYLFRKLYPRLTRKGSLGAVGYMDKIKSVYVSTPFLKSMCEHLGFDEYLHRIIYDPAFSFQLSKMTEDKEKENVVEAFFGCMEVQLDQYVGMYSGYGFVSNLIIDILENINIDYNPASLWSNVVLLKETNDKINSHNNVIIQANNGLRGILPNYNVIEQTQGMQMFYVVEKRSRARNEIWNEPGLKLAKQADKRKIQEELAGRTLELLRKDPVYRGLIQEAPTAESLGIEDLVK